MCFPVGFAGNLESHQRQIRRHSCPDLRRSLFALMGRDLSWKKTEKLYPVSSFRRICLAGRLVGIGCRDERSSRIALVFKRS